MYKNNIEQNAAVLAAVGFTMLLIHEKPFLTLYMAYLLIIGATILLITSAINKKKMGYLLWLITGLIAGIIIVFIRR